MAAFCGKVLPIFFALIDEVQDPQQLLRKGVPPWRLPPDFMQNWIERMFVWLLEDVEEGDASLDDDLGGVICWATDREAWTDRCMRNIVSQIMVVSKRIEAARSGLFLQLFDIATMIWMDSAQPFPWRDPRQTPAVFYPQLQSPGPFWPEEAAGPAGRVAAALRAKFREIRSEFLAALPHLQVTPGSGDRPEWLTVTPDCARVPIACSTLEPFFPFSRRPWASALQETWSYAGLPPKAHLALHNDGVNTRLNVDMVLTAGQYSWLQVGNIERSYGQDGTVFIYDVSYDHEAGNEAPQEGGPTRWTISVACSHPDYDKWFHELQPRPGHFHAQVDSAYAAPVQVPFGRAALWALRLARETLKGCPSEDCPAAAEAPAVWQYAAHNAIMALAAAPVPKASAAVDELRHLVAVLSRLRHAMRISGLQVLYAHEAVFTQTVQQIEVLAAAAEPLLEHTQSVEVRFQPPVPQPLAPAAAGAQCAASARSLGFLVCLNPDERETNRALSHETGVSNGRRSCRVAGNVEVPLMGLGTMGLEQGRRCVDGVLQSFRLGFRHLDTAMTYKNAACLGTALAESGLQREEVFIATKLHPGDTGDRASGDMDAIWEAQFSQHLLELRTDHVDALMLHFPGSSRDETMVAWRFLERLHRQGRARALGVSNFRVGQLRTLWDAALVRPSFQQVRWSLYEPAEAELSDELSDEEPIERASLLAWCAEHGLRTSVYFALSAAAFPLRALDDPHVQALAQEHHCSPAQVILRYLLELGFIVLAKASQPAHAAQNLLAFECALPRWELWRLAGLAGLAHADGAGLDGRTPHFVADVFGLSTAAADA